MTDDGPPPLNDRGPDDSVPPPPQGTALSPAWAKDSKAKLEEKYWSDEDRLRGVKLKNDILWHQVYGWVVVALMIFFVLTFCVSLAVWILHYVSPWGWLTPEQLSKIQSVIFSGTLGAIVSAYMQKRLTQ